MSLYLSPPSFRETDRMKLIGREDCFSKRVYIFSNLFHENYLIIIQDPYLHCFCLGFWGFRARHLGGHRPSGGRRPTSSPGSPTPSRPHSAHRRPREHQLRRRDRGCRVAVVLREALLPQRPPAAAHRDRAAHLLVQRAVRRLPGMLGTRNPHVGRLRTADRGDPVSLADGVILPWTSRARGCSTTSRSCWRVSPATWTSRWTPRGASSTRACERRSCTATTSR